MEKCTFCIQRIRRSKREASRDGVEVQDEARNINPACVNACPTDTLYFGDFNDPNSKVSKLKKKEFGDHGRGYELLGELGTEPNVIYLKKVDPSAKEEAHA